MITSFTVWLEATSDKFKPMDLYMGTVLLDLVGIISTLSYLMELLR